MDKLISQCPACGQELKIKVLQCCGCGLELRRDFQLHPFAKLNDEQLRFLITFLKHRGNLKLLQEEMKISYPYAKKKLTEVLTVLNIHQDEYCVSLEEETEVKIRLNKVKTNKASEIIKAKLAANGGRAVVSSFSGKQYGIKVDADGQHILCTDLPPVYTFEVFDIIVDLLKTKPNYTARKGNARNFKLGEVGCEENTVAGVILKEYFGKAPGESGFDPVFVLAAILEWAEIAHNNRGYLQLTASFSEQL